MPEEEEEDSVGFFATTTGKLLLVLLVVVVVGAVVFVLTSGGATAGAITLSVAYDSVDEITNFHINYSDFYNQLDLVDQAAWDDGSNLPSLEICHAGDNYCFEIYSDYCADVTDECIVDVININLALASDYMGEELFAKITLTPSGAEEALTSSSSGQIMYNTPVDADLMEWALS